MSNHHVLILKPKPIPGARQKFHNLGNPALFGKLAPGPWPLAPSGLHGLVKTHGPFAVTATVCSK
jgi:hypothetical protein